MSGLHATTSGRLRARRDLQLSPSDEGVIVKDPLTLEYFRLGTREHFLLEQLREPLSLLELTKRFRAKFPGDGATGRHVLAFCSALADCSLLLVDATGGSSKSSSLSRQRRFSWLSLLSPLAIRLPGVDPTPLLKVTGWLGWLVVSRWFFVAAIGAGLGIVTGFLSMADEVAIELPRFADLLQPQHALAAITAVVITKTWHELGHAIVCRRMGAECHEIGVMLLALIPCLYCDVSDAWTLRSRKKRVFIALAGVYFEFLLAMLAAAAWLILLPGPLRVLAMYVVVTATISTLLVNLNPLLRYDGYYVLADAWGVANLHQQSREQLWSRLRRWIQSDPTPPESPTTSPTLLMLYGLASTVYSWALLAFILWLVYRGLEAVGFAAVGDLLLVLTLGGVVLAPVRSASRLLPRGLGRSKLRAIGRFSLLAGLVASLAVVALMFPIEQSLRSPCRMQSVRFAEVTAQSDGLLQPQVDYGDRVTAGQLLAELADPAAERRGLELREREATLTAEIAGLRTRSQTDIELLGEIARLTPVLNEVRRQQQAHEIEGAKRQLRAPIAGVVYRPAERQVLSTEAIDQGELATWSGAPLDPANKDCQLASGETLCRIAEEELHVVILLDENQSGLVRLGDRVRVALDRDPAIELSGTVQAVAPAAAENDLTDNELALEAGMRSALETGSAYRVTVALEATTPACQPGAIGQARIVTGEETLGGWCLRWLYRLTRLG